MRVGNGSWRGISKFVDFVSVNNRRTLIIGFSNCGKTHLTNYILLQKQETIFIKKAINQNPYIKAQTTDKNQPFENSKNNTFVFLDMSPSKQENNIELFFTRGRHKIIDVYYISQSYFHLSKSTIRNIFNLIVLYEETQWDIC